MAQINKPTDYFNTKLYTGNGSTQSITGVGFQPDMVWTKVRSTTDNHNLEDAVRGAGETLYPDLTLAEYTDATAITSFDSDGYSIGSQGNVNANTQTFVSWNWLASNTTASNTDGSITSTVSANTTSGFSIVSYTGTGANATIGHGLSSVPKTIIIKNRSTADSWMVYHVGAGSNAYLHLETTNGALSPSTAQFQATTPTSSFFYVGTADGTNKSSSNMIAYCFAEKKGFSKFGSYVGNLSDDGVFCYLGFKPSFLMVKDTTTAEDWFMYDNRRPSYNYNHYLRANTSGAEVTTDNWVDFLSNGFKLRKGQTGTNRSGDTYIYMAFASEPLVGSNNVPATAR
jgi:hypothetical protein